MISSYCPPKSHFQPRGAVEGVLNQRSSDQTKENQATQGLVQTEPVQIPVSGPDWRERGYSRPCLLREASAVWLGWGPCTQKQRASDGGSLAGQSLGVWPSNSFHDCSFIPVLDFGSYWNIGGKITCKEQFWGLLCLLLCFVFVPAFPRICFS